MTASQRLLKLEGTRLIAWTVPNGKIAVSFENCEIKNGMFLVADFGTGEMLESACENYLEKIQGKTLVFDACTSARKEVRVL